MSMRAFVMVLLGALALTVFAVKPPMPRGRDAPAMAFSAERAMDDVRRIADRPHPTGSPENAAVRSYILERMRALGMEVFTSEGLISERALARINKWSGRSDTAMPLINLIGVLPGRDRSLPPLMLMSHHDTVWGSPGAADDTAGVATSLEVLRAIKAKGQPQRDVVMLVTDAEELGLEGAKHFFAEHPMSARIGAIINMEARGSGGRAWMFQTSRDNGAVVDLYASAVAQPASNSLAAYVYSVLPNDTDLTPALKGPFSAYNIAFIGRSGLYHSPLATPDRLDQGSLQDMGQQALSLTNAMAYARDLPAKAPDVVYFDLFGLITLSWPVWLGWVMLALSAAAIGFAVRREGRVGLAQGAGRMVGLMLASGVGLYAFNRLSTMGGHDEYYDRLAAIPRLEVMAALVCGAAFLLLFGTGKPSPGRSAGAALPILAMGIAAQLLAPTTAYVLIVPMLLAALVLYWPNRWALIAVGVLVTAFVASLGHFLMQGVGTTMPMAAALPLAIAVMAQLPLWPGMEKRPARLAITALLVGAAGVALWVQLDDPAETRAVYADNKTFVKIPPKPRL
jgi:hypothetical protein